MKRKLELNRETLRALDSEKLQVARGGGGVVTLQCQVTILQTKVGNTCNGASCFPTCAPQ